MAPGTSRSASLPWWTFARFPCWLLLADIADSTGLSNRVPAEQLPMIIGRWFAETKQVVEAHGGRSTNIWGRILCLLAVHGLNHSRLSAAIQGLKELQAAERPDSVWWCITGRC